MFYTFEYSHYLFKAFWSKNVNKLIEDLNKTKAKSHATHHEIGLKFINKVLFEGKGEFDKRRREKEGIYYDLKVPSRNAGKTHFFIEYKLYSGEVNNLNKVLDKREKIFAQNDYLYFSYFLERKWKDKTKILKTQKCIYYLVVIILSKKVESLNLKELLDDIKRDAKDFTEKLAHESGVDLEEEELLDVENIIKVADLERELEKKDILLEEKDTLLKENKKIIKQKDKEIKLLKKQLKLK